MSEFWRKLRRLRRRDELNDRLREELEFHAAMSGESIGRTSRLLEQSHDVWTLGWLEHLWLDCRHAARALAKSPAFALLATLGTALGVAAVTSVWSVADRALLRPLPYADPGRLAIVSDQLLKLGLTRFPTSVPNLLDYRAQSTIFADVAAFQPRAFTVAANGRTERVPGMAASPNLLAVLGVRPAEGRWWTDEERHEKWPWSDPAGRASRPPDRRRTLSRDRRPARGLRLPDLRRGARDLDPSPDGPRSARRHAIPGGRTPQAGVSA